MLSAHTPTPPHPHDVNAPTIAEVQSRLNRSFTLRRASMRRVADASDMSKGNKWCAQLSMLTHELETERDVLQQILAFPPSAEQKSQRDIRLQRVGELRKQLQAHLDSEAEAEAVGVLEKMKDRVARPKSIFQVETPNDVITTNDQPESQPAPLSSASSSAAPATLYHQSKQANTEPGDQSKQVKQEQVDQSKQADNPKPTNDNQPISNEKPIATTSPANDGQPRTPPKIPPYTPQARKQELSINFGPDASFHPPEYYYKPKPEHGMLVTIERRSTMPPTVSPYREPPKKGTPKMESAVSGSFQNEEPEIRKREEREKEKDKTLKRRGSFKLSKLTKKVSSFL
eukprot:comp5852_c0_seq1/m.1716 comp5852_c0_seq1/g.1716  ORF comp5852_c0_seq1/g.1716 comp5852_c0_seq1/m.1716 type:complete len:343 (-) comp5852_c0_seq1:58-1086(-)